jgi:hypothetical protein
MLDELKTFVHEELKKLMAPWQAILIEIEAQLEKAGGKIDLEHGSLNGGEDIILRHEELKYTFKKKEGKFNLYDENVLCHSIYEYASIYHVNLLLESIMIEVKRSSLKGSSSQFYALEKTVEKGLFDLLLRLEEKIVSLKQRSEEKIVKVRRFPSEEVGGFDVDEMLNLLVASKGMATRTRTAQEKDAENFRDAVVLDRGEDAFVIAYYSDYNIPGITMERHIEIFYAHLSDNNFTTLDTVINDHLYFKNRSIYKIHYSQNPNEHKPHYFESTSRNIFYFKQIEHFLSEIIKK